MKTTRPGIPLLRDGSGRWHPLWISAILFMLLLSLFFEQLSGGGTVVFATSVSHPTGGNPNPALTAPSWLQQPQAAKPEDLGIYVQGKQNPAVVPIAHPAPVVNAPETLTLTPQAQQFVSKDRRLEVDVAASTVTSQQIQAAGGTIHLKVVQVGAESGGSSSGHIILGSYQLLLQNATGKALTNLVLAHPLTIRYRLPSEQEALLWQNQQVYAVWNDTTTASPSASSSQANAQRSTGAATTTASTPKPHLLPTQKDATGLVWSVSSTLPHAAASSSPTTMTPQAATALTAAASSSSITFSTQTPQASWGTPTDSQVGLNSGGLTYSYPLSLPPGPGGSTPSLNLAYSSGAANEAYNVQGTAPWVGEGWSLGLGSISWGQENVTPGTTNRMENVWSISDPAGISGQLIPPDLNAATSAPTSPAMSSLPAQYIWHTAPESHAKVQEVNFNGQPCWHVWLPNGTMQEFGCTDEARQSAPDATGTMNPYRWDLDLIVDRNGNQIRVHYQRNWPSGQGIRDAVISSIEYDDPTCHNTTFNGATAACASWNPQVKIVFDASNKVTNLTNSDCQGWSDANLRCDDPVDLSSSGGIPAPKATNVYVLNDVQVLVNNNLLNKYVFSYEQSHPTTFTDPLSGLQESARGYLDLTKIQELGTNGTALNAPVTTISYQNQTQHYEDMAQHATPTSNCGFSWMHSDSNGCFLWSQSYNTRYISTLDNGRGWHENITWGEARANVHGVDSGAVNDVFTCDGQESSSNLCGQADDESWSRIVVKQRQEITNGVTSTWSYKYYLRTGWPSPPCGNCNQGDVWGNINDNDFADYYNYTFTSFASAEVTNPDNSYQIDYFNSSDGIGLASSSITCYTASCHVAPYANPDPGLAGQTTQEQNYDTNGTLLSVVNMNYAMNCPPPGVGHSGNASGPPSDIGDTQLSSELDQNNPVVVCDPRVTQEDSYQVDGVTDINNYLTDARVVHKQVNTTYDSDNRGSSFAGGYDYGNVSRVDTTGNDINNAHVVTGTTYYPNDNLGAGVYLTGLPAYSFTLDGAGNNYNCTASVYGSNANPAQAPASTLATSAIAFLNNGGCNDSSATASHTYDASGNPITGIDGDQHLGCTNGSSQYSACATYDASDTHLLTATNAKNQKVTYGYDSTATGGFGQWIVSSTDANGQITSYQYDALGRLTAILRPGDTTSAPSVSYTYNNTCTNGSTTPCIEMDTTTRINAGGSTAVSKQWYDGMGRLVETISPAGAMLSQVPAIPAILISYTIYDAMGRATIASKPYAIPSYAGSPGPSGATYTVPDTTQARTVTRYDGAGRTLGQVTYGNATSILLTSSTSYTVAQGVPGFTGDASTPFERTTTTDAYNHQQISFHDALGRNRYGQVYSGTGTPSNPYVVVRTVQSTYDTVGDVTSTVTFDQNSKQLAYQNATYDGVKRVTGSNDADSGSCSNTPLPASCSSSTDTAWKATYDADGNRLTQTDPRGQTTYTSYDALDRPLCQGSSAAVVNPCQNSADDLYFYDSYNNASNPSVTFPTGCAAPGGSYTSEPVGTAVAEAFSGSAGSGWRCSSTNARGQQDMSTLSVTADGQTTTQTVYATYNQGGDLATLTYPDGETVTSTYDNNGFFRGLANSNGAIVSSVVYKPTGQLSSMVLGGLAYQGSSTALVKLSMTYDAISRPLSTSASVSGTTLFSQTRTYDNVGNVLQASTTVPTTTGGSKTDSQSFCYDELNRLIWSGNSGTPTGSDHCGLSPSGTTVPTYQQSYSYDAMDRLTSGPDGTTSYDPSHVHAADTESNIPNTYASYDAMGNMTCRNVDTTASHSCATGSQTGATMTYNNQGRLSTWTAPSGTTASDQFLYDNAGNRVLQRTSTTTAGTTTTSDIITFDGYTDTTITNGTATTTKYYSAAGRQVAMTTGGKWYYLLSDVLGSTSVTLSNTGTATAVQLFSPYGSVRYSDGTIPTPHNFTGQRLDSQTGLLYYNARYYDPAVGQFTSADPVQGNAQGLDPYGYVGGNPETMTDPTGYHNCGDDACDTWQPPIQPPPSSSNSGGDSSAGEGYCNNYGCYDGNGNLLYHRPQPQPQSQAPQNNDGNGCGGCDRATTPSGGISTDGGSSTEGGCNTDCGNHDRYLLTQFYAHNGDKIKAAWDAIGNIYSLVHTLMASVVDGLAEAWGPFILDLISTAGHIASLLGDLRRLGVSSIPPILGDMSSWIQAAVGILDASRGFLKIFSPGGWVKNMLSFFEDEAANKLTVQLLRTLAGAGGIPAAIATSVVTGNLDLSVNPQISSYSNDYAQQQCIALHANVMDPGTSC